MATAGQARFRIEGQRQAGDRYGKGETGDKGKTLESCHSCVSQLSLHHICAKKFNSYVNIQNAILTVK